MIIQIIIHGFNLYRIEIKFSIESIIVNINAKTKNHDPIVQIISKVLLFHWYIKVVAITREIIMGIIIKIHFWGFILDIIENLLRT